jgi:hypothetical protein
MELGKYFHFFYLLLIIKIPFEKQIIIIKFAVPFDKVSSAPQKNLYDVISYDCQVFFLELVLLSQFKKLLS